VLQSPDGERIVVVLHVGGVSMGPITVTCWQAWMGRAIAETIPLTDLTSSLEKGGLVHATGSVLALGLKCFEMHTQLMAKQ